MADKKPSGFRFRLPWLTKAVLTPSPAVAPEPPSQPTRSAPPTQPPRTTTQTSVQRPPFRPPGKAPAPAAQPTVATPTPTPAPASPRQSPPQSVSSPPPPPPSVPVKSPVTKSPIAKSGEPVGIQPTKETEATTKTTQVLETPGLATPPQRSPLRPSRQSQSPPSPPQTPPPTILTESSPPESPMAKTIETVATQPAKDSQTLTETMPTIEMPGPATLLQRSPLGPPKQAQPQPGHLQTPPPSKPDSQSSSPSRMHTPPQPNSQHLSPSHTVAQPNVPTNPSSLSPESTRTRATTHPLSPVQVQPSQTRTPPKSPSRSPSPPTKTTSEFAEIKRPTEITDEKFPNDSNHVTQADDLSLNAKPRDITHLKGPETESMNLHTLETKSQKAKPTTTTRLSLPREIKDDISQFINKILATSLPKQYIDEKHASIITLAGENKGASMHLASDNAIKQDSKLGDNQETKAILNSNAQGINNSVMFNSSATERSPGVHLRISRDLANINDSDMSDTDLMEMQRAEVNITPPQKLVYNPAFGIDDLEVSVTGNEIEVF